nr:MAG TPA: Cytosine specific methyltransferase [Caudoviricetes sp.]
MAAYYNEIDPFAAQWLRNLIDAGLIAPGVVDERSITDVTAADLNGFTQCHFFAGIGGWSLALRQASVPDSYACWTGSPPCQPFSVAGKQLAQLDDRHLAPAFIRLVVQCRPAKIFGEQVSAAINKGWLDDLFTELETEGYACAAAVLPACGIGAPHKRDRLIFGAVGNAHHTGLQGRDNGSHQLAGKERWKVTQRPAGLSGFWSATEEVECWDGKTRHIESGTFPLVNGIPRHMGRGKSSLGAMAGRNRTGRLKGYGNAIVPELAAEFITAFLTVTDETSS